MRLPVQKQVIIPVGILLVLMVIALLVYYQSHGGARELLFSGTVEATEVEISPELSAKVATLYHQEGDEVEEGDSLLDLNKSDVEAQLRAAEAAQQAAEDQSSLALAKMENARRDFDRSLQLYRAKAIAESKPTPITVTAENRRECLRCSQDRL